MWALSCSREVARDVRRVYGIYHDTAPPVHWAGSAVNFGLISLIWSQYQKLQENVPSTGSDSK
jgi:hypothetical protein